MQNNRPGIAAYYSIEGESNLATQDNRPDVALYYSPLIRIGGAERQWANELRALRSAGCQVTGVTHDAPAALLSQLSLSGNLVQSLGGQSHVLGRVMALRRWLVNVRPRLLVAQSSPELTFLATRGLEVRSVVYQNSPPFYESEKKNPYPLAFRHRSVYRRLSAATPGYLEFTSRPRLTPLRRFKLECRAFLKYRAMRSATMIVVLSRRAAAEVSAMYSVPATVVRGCIDERLMSYRPKFDMRYRHGLGGRQVLLSICRLDRVKRVDALLLAFARLRPTAPELALVIGGRGPEEERLKKLTHDLGIQTDVVFTGYLDEQVIWDYYSAADVFVAPATADFNIAPYEALALGRKVVVSNELELEPWIASSGWVFQAQPTPISLAQAILASLKSSPSRRLDLSTLTWSARASRLLDLFEPYLCKPGQSKANHLTHNAIPALATAQINDARIDQTEGGENG